MTQWLDASLLPCDSGGMLNKSEIKSQKSEGNPKFEIQSQKPGENGAGECDLVPSRLQRWSAQPNNSDFGLPSGLLASDFGFSWPGPGGTACNGLKWFVTLKI
jgi:hypothetical protein